MSDFKDTTNWEQKDANTLTYIYELDGERRESDSKREPQRLTVRLVKASLFETASWQTRESDGDNSVGYQERDFIRAEGLLTNCTVYAVRLGSADNQAFKRIGLSIYPCPLDKLVERSTESWWSIDRGERETPEEGWLNTELGVLSIHEADEYTLASSLSARLFLDETNYVKLRGAIRDQIRQPHYIAVEILADLFHFHYQGFMASPYTMYDYAILCRERNGRDYFNTKARLDELTIETTTRLNEMSFARQWLDDEDDFPSSNGSQDEMADKSMQTISKEVAAIRSRLDGFWNFVVAALILFVVAQVLNWVIG